MRLGRTVGHIVSCYVIISWLWPRFTLTPLANCVAEWLVCRRRRVLLVLADRATLHFPVELINIAILMLFSLFLYDEIHFCLSNVRNTTHLIFYKPGVVLLTSFGIIATKRGSVVSLELPANSPVHQHLWPLGGGVAPAVVAGIDASRLGEIK